jgi:hypothetical protein
LKTKIFPSTLKNAPDYYNAGVVGTYVVVDSTVTGLPPEGSFLNVYGKKFTPMRRVGTNFKLDANVV